MSLGVPHHALPHRQLHAVADGVPGFVVREMLLAEKVAALRRKAGSGDAWSPENEGRPEGSRPSASQCYAGRGAYWTLAVSEAAAFKVKAQLGVMTPPLLHSADQITDRPLVALRVMLVPTEKVAEPVVPTGTLRPAGA